MKNASRIATLYALTMPFLVVSVHAQKWTTPTPEELSMTSIPEVPGAAAVYLNKEQATDDGMHKYDFYVRLKVLNEKGMDYANVELPFVGGMGGYIIDAIAGRTVHPDGSIVEFKDKPYEKLVMKSAGLQYKAKVFTLPSVTVGSIIEYRYTLRLDDNWFMSPDWSIQSELYTRKAHYMWRPTNAVLQNEDGSQSSQSVAWTPILPAGVKVVEKPLYTSLAASSTTPTKQLDLDVHDIPPIPKEEFMPPIGSISYRVLFYYTDVKSAQEFWTREGKRWSKARDKFVGPNNGVKQFVAGIVTPSDTQDQKARKLYEAVEQMENTEFTRERSTREDKAGGLKQINNTDDILARKRGNGDQLAELFVAMCRAAGLKAYVMGVADRSERIFVPEYLSLRQIDDYIAIVNIDGKDVFFDPGQRFCEAERLAWKHTLIGGLRQIDGGTAIVATPGTPYKDEHVDRTAVLTLDDHGLATGTATVSYTGDAALRWRQEALKGDDTSLNEDLKANLEHMLPGGMEVRVTSVDHLAEFDKPLAIHYEVKGPIGSSTGKRLLVTANVFETNEKPKFPEPKREVAVDMRYPSITSDAVRIKYPEGLVVESAPADAKISYPNSAAFSTSSKTAPGSITLYRNFINGRTLYLEKDYADLRGFYSKVETKDQETLVLTRAVPGAAAAAPTATAPVATTTKPSGN